jgi:hypothetical protein
MKGFYPFRERVIVVNLTLDAGQLRGLEMDLDNAMTAVRDVAIGVYAIDIAALLFFGLLYASRSEFMPYHSEAVKTPWTSLPAGTRTLLVALINGLGYCMCGFAPAMALMLIIPFRRNDPWAVLALPVLLLIVQAGLVRIARRVASETGAHTPWKAPIGGICLTLLGALLSALSR